jgi:hypothetical protein
VEAFSAEADTVTGGHSLWRRARLEKERWRKQRKLPLYFIRGLQVMLDEDLVELYEIETRRLNEQVKRNAERFPEDFMFQLSKEEYENLKSQNATSSWGGQCTFKEYYSEKVKLIRNRHPELAE